MFFPCTGLGRQQRGFETFTRECAAALSSDPRLELTVFAGGAEQPTSDHVLWNLARDSRAARLVGQLMRREPYYAEQASFFLSLLPRLVRGRPDVLYFADLGLGNLCWHWRRLTGQRYRMLFYNGGMTTMPFTRADVIQQLTPAGLDEATVRGEDPTRQIVLPHGLEIPAMLPARLPLAERARLHLPVDRPIVLSVGLLDESTKHMAYLVNELAALPSPRPFLCMLGAANSETPALRAQALRLLGEGNFLMTTVPRERIGDYYLAADVFTMASLREGFGLAYVEALAHGLPVIAHDTPVTRYLMGALGQLADLTVAGALSAQVARALQTGPDETLRAARHRSAYARFSWAMLRERYATMLLDVAARSAA